MRPKHRSFCNERLAGQLEYGDFYDISVYANENWMGYYLEFRDTNGVYRSWKQNFDGGYAELKGDD